MKDHSETTFSGIQVLDEPLLLTETECRACGSELATDGADANRFLTDGSAESSTYCTEHLRSYLSVCVECCGVYTANLGGICEYCLGRTND